jgi:TctA family transporter
MLMSQGSLSILWQNWLVGGISALAIALLLWPFLAPLRARLRKAPEPA